MTSDGLGVCGSQPDSLLIAPVTALRFVGRLLLAGEGPVLKIYDIPSRTLQTSCNIFKAATIHGLTIGPSVDHTSCLVAVHGAKSCGVLRLHLECASVTIQHVEEFSDWLLAVTWLRKEDDHHLVLATAHNCILRWNWREKLVTENVHCQEKCILYSALLVGDRWRHLVCCGGTVFNQVVIWGVSGTSDQAGRRTVWHRLVGHQGVIFSMTFDPTTHLLSSVSDDRSIRVWKMGIAGTAHAHSVITTDTGRAAGSGCIGQVVSRAGTDQAVDSADTDQAAGSGDTDQVVGSADTDQAAASAGTYQAVGSADTDQATGSADTYKAANSPDSDQAADSADTDQVVSSADNDQVVGSADNDQVVGSADNDQVLGSADNDQVVGNDDNDQAIGSADTATRQAGGTQHILGTPGTTSDTVRAEVSMDTKHPQVSTDNGEAAVAGDADQSAASIWESAQFTLLHVLYGHRARVWEARFLGNQLVTVGEDSTCCVWDAQGQIVLRFKGHLGKGIWSLAVSDTWRLVATGGGDAGIRLWEVGAAGTAGATDTSAGRAGPGGAANTTAERAEAPDTTAGRAGAAGSTAGRAGAAGTTTGDPDTTTAAAGAADKTAAACRLIPPPHLVDVKVQFSPKVTRLVDKHKVLIMTDSGTLYQYDMADDTWQVVTHDDMYRSYSVLSVSPGGATISVGNIYGTVKLISKDGRSEMNCHEGKVFSVVWLSDKQLLTTGPDGKMTIWGAQGVTLRAEVTLTLPAARQRWVAAAEVLADDNLLVVGDRAGSVHVYDLCQAATSDPAQSFWKVHGKAGVTDVRYHGNHVYTAGRDGEYRQYDVTERRLELLHSCKVLKGLEWIARLHFTNEDMHVIGFFNDLLIVRSVATHQTLLALPCGGGHRAWDLTQDDVTGHVTFVYVKAGQVVLCRLQLRLQHSVLQPSLHGRDLMDVKLISATSHTDGSASILATSSEDTRINIVGLRYRHGLVPEHSILATINGHISSVRALATSPSYRSNRGHGCHSNPESCQENTNTNQVVLFSAGGRAQLKAWRISTSFNIEITGPEPHREDERGSRSRSSGDAWPMRAQYEQLATYDLHEKGNRKRTPWRKAAPDPNPETRYMALSSAPVWRDSKSTTEQLHLVVAACSDGFLRVTCFDEVRRRFHMIAQAAFHDHCVLKTLLLPTTSGTVVCSAGTDGRIAFWDLTDLLRRYLDCVHEECCHLAGDADMEGSSEPCQTDLTADLLTPDLVVQAHQSGVNALDVYAVNDTEYLMATGGDDNSLTLHRLAVTDAGHAGRGSLSVIGTGRKTTAHATQITGVSIDDEQTIRSVSIDQRLVTWSLTPTLELTQASCRYVHVADVTQMHTWRIGAERHTAVTGVGLEYMVS